MPDTAIITLLAEFDDTDGTIFARMRNELLPALRRTTAVPPSLVRAVLERDDERTASDIARPLGMNARQLRGLYQGPALGTLRWLRRPGRVDPRAPAACARDVTELIGRHLGARPAAWNRLLAALSTFPGSLAALVADSGRPGPAGSDAVPCHLTAPAGHGLDMRHLLLLAPPADLVRLIPAMRPRTLFDLVRAGADLPEEILRETVARAGPQARLALARARRVSPTVTRLLIGLGDPELNAAVYLNPHTTMALRASIMAGPAPLHEDVVARVCGDWAATIRYPALWSGDPLLVRVALLRRTVVHASLAACVAAWRAEGVAGVRALMAAHPWGQGGWEASAEPFKAPRYRSLRYAMVLRVWERAGAAEAARLVDEVRFPVAEEARLRALLAAGDGLETLRADVAARIGTRTLIRRLRAGLPEPHWPFLETSTIDWALIEHANRRAPFGADAMAALAAQPGCPPALRRAFRDPLVRGPRIHGARLPADLERMWAAGDRLTRPGEPVKTREAAGAGNAAGTGVHGAFGAGDRPAGTVGGPGPGPGPVPGPVGAGSVSSPGAGSSSRRLLHRVRPAAVAATALAHRDVLLPGAGGPEGAMDRLRELIGRHLGADPGTGGDARVVALRMLPDFPGSLAELLVTAGAAARG